VKKATLAERLRYWFDNVMGRGAGAVIALLGGATLVFIVVVAAIVEIFHIFPTGQTSADLPFGESIWQNMLHSIDGGTIASVPICRSGCT